MGEHPKGKVALLFLKMKTQMSFPKLAEAAWLEGSNGVLERGLLDDGKNTTLNPGDDARTKRKNDIKRRV